MNVRESSFEEGKLQDDVQRGTGRDAFARGGTEDGRV